MSTWATLAGGNGWAINLEGTIYRTGYTFCEKESQSLMSIAENYPIELPADT